MGSIHDIAWDTGQEPSSMPSLLLIKFGEYTGPIFAHFDQRIIPVFLLLASLSLRELHVPVPSFLYG